MKLRIPELPLTVEIDLRSGPRYPTGLAMFDAAYRLAELVAIRSDEKIFPAIERWRPKLIAIDAPLGLPEGCCCTDSHCALRLPWDHA